MSYFIVATFPITKIDCLNYETCEDAEFKCHGIPPDKES